MPSLATLSVFAVTTLILTASPGPGVFYVWARALSQGRRAGFASMFGIEFGEVMWLAATAAGLAALLATSSGILTFLRFGGAAYLVFLGIQRWRSVEPFEAPPPAPARRLFVQGFITQLLNPKVAVFFTAFLPAFISPASPIAPQVAVLGCVYVAVALCVDTSYVLGAAALSRRFMASRVAQRRFGRLAAGTYWALAFVAAAERPAA